MSYKKHPAFGELMPISDVYERLSIGASSYTARQSQGLFPRHILDGRGKYLPVAEFDIMMRRIEEFKLRFFKTQLNQILMKDQPLNNLDKIFLSKKDCFQVLN